MIHYITFVHASETLNWILPIAFLFLTGVCLTIQDTRFWRALTLRPAFLLLSATCIGILASLGNLPEIPQDISSGLAQTLIAALFFAATLQFRISNLYRHCIDVFRLSIFAAPLFLAFTSIVCFIFIPSMSISGYILIAGALMLNGAKVDQHTIKTSSVSPDLKFATNLESAVILAIGLPIVLLVETLTFAPQSQIILLDFLSIPVNKGLLSIAIGFASGGSLGLITAKICNMKEFSARTKIIVYACAGCLAYTLSPMIAGNAIFAAGAAGLILSEEGRLPFKARRICYKRAESIAAPIGYILFGFVLGPRILNADSIQILFAVCAVTFLRIFPRWIALQKSNLSLHEKNFLVWFGGAPGISSALYLLILSNNPLIIEQELAISVCATCIVLSVLATRITTRPLAKYFIREISVARKRRFTA